MASPVTSVVFIIIFVVLLFGVVSFIGAPYVPSQKRYVKRVFEYLGLNESDVVVDVGSGDGVVLRTASSFGATAIGYEINPILAIISKVLSFFDKRVLILFENFWTAKLPSRMTLVYAFSVSRDERKLIKLMQREANRLGRPLRLLCYGSPFRRMEAVDHYEAYHLYIFQPLQRKKA